MPKDESEEMPEFSVKDVPLPEIPSGIPSSVEEKTTEAKPQRMEVAETFRKPRHKGNGRTISDAVSSAVEKVKSVVAEKPKVSMSKRQSDTKERDAKRMRAVKGFSEDYKDVIRFLVSASLRKSNVVVSEENVDAVMRRVLTNKRFVGYYVDRKGAFKRRELPIHKALAYTTGAVALSAEDRAIDWANENPTFHDLLMTAINGAIIAYDIAAGETAAFIATMEQENKSEDSVPGETLN